MRNTNNGQTSDFTDFVRAVTRNRDTTLWRAVCIKNNVDVVKLILGRVARGRGLVGVTYVGVAYTKWIVVVLLCSCLLVTGHPSVSVRVTVSKSLCLCH